MSSEDSDVVFTMAIGNFKNMQGVRGFCTFDKDIVDSAKWLTLA